MYKTIALVNGKGGVGKTTVTLLLAAALKVAGQDVALIDCDPQRSATVFAPNMGLEVDAPAAVRIIDTPPNIGHTDTLEAVRTADLVILITTPSPTDLGATAATAGIIKRERKGKKTVILFNRVQASNRFADTVPAMAAALPFPALRSILYQRTAYQVAQLEGWKALPPAARAEVIQLALELVK